MIVYVILTLYLAHQALCDDPPFVQMDAAEFMETYSKSGYTAAYGDINSDKQTDVFVISGDGKEVLIFLGSELTTVLGLNQTIHLNDAATSVVPGDFNGDDVSDLLITHRSDDSNGKDDCSRSIHTFSIYWGSKDGGIQSNNETYESSGTFFDEPLFLDANADMIPDLFVVYQNQTRAFLLGQQSAGNWDFAVAEFDQKDLLPVRCPHSHAFIDLTGEGSADLFITSSEDGKPVFEVWQGSSSGIVLHDVIRTSESELFKNPNLVVGPASFADFDASGSQKLLVPTCVSDGERCTEGAILIYTNHQWHNISFDVREWTFPNSKELPHTLNKLHIADFNLDSYPDILYIMQRKDGIRKAVVLYNEPCSAESCPGVDRQLSVSAVAPDSDNSVLASFYDFNMDGTLDVIVSCKDDDGYEMKAYKNMVADDVLFLRVQVLSGHADAALYGVNVPGPQMKYETSNAQGFPQCGSVGQLSQSAHLSLQLPYVIFGLGRLANFVDSLTVSIPVPLILDTPGLTSEGNKLVNTTHKMALNATWPMLIPNSQMYVIPYPMTQPSSWKNRLLVRPGRNIVTTGIVLLATCGVLIIATLVLHWMEKREDRQEKIQEAHNFHFDAM